MALNLNSELKTCFKCGQEKERAAFYRHPMMADGLLGKCRECAIRDSRETRNKRIDYYNACRRVRSDPPRKRDTEAARESKRRSNDAWIARNKEKRLAHSAINNAVKRGLVAKPSACEACGKTGLSLHGHHDDYSAPLSVRWLCPKCHGAWHRKYDRQKDMELVAAERRASGG